MRAEMIKELKDMLWILLDDVDDLPQPITMNILMEHLDSGAAEYPCRLLQFIGCKQLLRIEAYLRVIMKASIYSTCITVFASFRTQALYRIPSVIAPSDRIVRAVHCSSPSCSALVASL